MGYDGPRNPDPEAGNLAIYPYGYRPHIAMGIIGCLTFFAVAMPHLWWFLKKRGTRSVHGLFFFAAMTEVLAYGARLSSRAFPSNGMSHLIGIYLVQVATILVTAALYKAIQRGIKYTPNGSQLSPMRPRSILAVFIPLDVVWVLMQIGGEWLVAGGESAEVTGDEGMFSLGTSQLVFLAGNVLQGITVLILCGFLFVIMKRSNTLLASADPSLQYPLLKPLWIQIFASFGLFFVRLIIRIARGAQGAYGSVTTNEVYFGIFEYLPIFLIFVLWAARPLYKFIFPLGHRHGEGAHTREFVTPAAAPSSHSATTTSHPVDSKV